MYDKTHLEMVGLSAVCPDAMTLGGLAVLFMTFPYDCAVTSKVYS